MPVVVTVRGYRLFFYSYEGHPREPLRVHVRRAECQAKVWIEPAITMGSSFGFRNADEREIMDIVHDHVEVIRRRWNEHFGS